MSAIKLLLIVLIFLFSTGCDSTNHAYTKQLSNEDFISIAIEEARVHEDWDEIVSDGCVQEASTVNSSFQKGISVVTVSAVPFGPGREAHVFIDIDGKVIGYIGGK